MTTSELKSKLTKSLEHLEQELAQIRTGRASPALLENIAVDAYGTKMTVKELGTIGLLDSQNLMIQIWDKSLQGAVVSAVRESDLKVNPVIDGSVIRVPIPTLTEERRKEFTRLLHQKAEEAKIKSRQIREDILKKVQAAVKEKTARENDLKNAKDEIQKVIDEFNKKIDDLTKKKETELMQ